MKVKIWGVGEFDHHDQPVMLTLNSIERENIAKMAAHATKICSYENKKYTKEEIDQWMGPGLPLTTVASYTDDHFAWLDRAYKDMALCLSVLERPRALVAVNLPPYNIAVGLAHLERVLAAWRDPELFNKVLYIF